MQVPTIRAESFHRSTIPNQEENPLSTPALSALSVVPEFVIEEHIASTNRLFQLTRLTLDDLSVYAKPISDAVLAVMRRAHDSITETDAHEIIRRAAVVEYRA